MMQKGCACRFLYGPGTDQEKITEISKALEAKIELQVEVQFYRKNGRNLQYGSDVENDKERGKYPNTTSSITRLFMSDYFSLSPFFFYITLNLINTD